MWWDDRHRDNWLERRVDCSQISGGGMADEEGYVTTCRTTWESTWAVRRQKEGEALWWFS
jgi:hypothetical protein